MKFLFSARTLLPITGGSDKSILNLMVELKKKGHTIDAIIPGKENENVTYKGINLMKIKTPFFLRLLKSHIWVFFANNWWYKVLDKYVKNKKYDFLLTHLDTAPAIIFVAKKHGVKACLFLRSYKFLCPYETLPSNYKRKFLDLPFLYKLQYPFINLNMKKFSKSFNMADTIIANSDFIRKVFQEKTNKNIFVLYPTIDKKIIKVNSQQNKYILYVTPMKQKGLKLFLKICAHLKHEHFLVIGHTFMEWDNIIRMSKTNNVKYLGWEENIDKIYLKSRLLLNPVEWEEPFGRVPLEAMIFGIPSISYKKGGIPEAVGGAGDLIDSNSDFDTWIQTIKKYDDIDYYKTKSKECFKQFKKFGSKDGCEKFLKLIKNK
ncbi:glycosyltransferase family 4 protein [Candidatus Woesearchaeota archaeon]|nr:glycosyltransferase family 4 protein [Candidatus Woesearchaeota archaeon]